jgi:hypothetical protein
MYVSAAIEEKKGRQMNSPIQMLEIVAADIAENTVLLELIYKHSNEDHETDCAMACLIRSMKKTLTTNEYIKSLSDSPAPQREHGESDISDEIFHATVTARKLEELAHVYNEVYFTDELTANQQCIWHPQFSTMRLRCVSLIEAKLN